MSASAEQSPVRKRVPAEWEPQAAVWLQWPSDFERVFKPAFALMTAILCRYEQFNILFDSVSGRDQARRAIEGAGANPEHHNIEWISMPPRSYAPKAIFPDATST